MGERLQKNQQHDALKNVRKAIGSRTAEIALSALLVAWGTDHFVQGLQDRANGENNPTETVLGAGSAGAGAASLVKRISRR